MSTRAQCEVKGCSAAAAKNLPCCRDHKCEEENCTSTVALSEDKKRSFCLCPSHKCAYPTCGFRRMPGFNGCSGATDHTCILPKCQNIIADHDRVVCVSHIALECSEEGCTSLAAKKNTSDRYYYCGDHIKCKSCPNNRLLHSAGCSTHTCWRRACYKPIKNGAYCKEHKCSAETCLQAPQVNEAGIFRKTCFIHTCQFPNCQEVNKTEKIGYCKTHCCAHDGCARYRCDHLDLTLTAEHLCLQHHDEKLKSEEQARIDEKMKADEKAKAEKDKAEAAEKAKADEKGKAEAEKKAKAEEKAKAEKDKAEAAEKEKAERAEKAEAEKKAKAEAEEKKKAEAEEKKKKAEAEEKKKAEEKAKSEEKEKPESKSLAVKAPMTNGTTSISSTTLDDLKKLLEAIQKSQQSSFADVKATLKQIDEFDRQTILALAKRNK